MPESDVVMSYEWVMSASAEPRSLDMPRRSLNMPRRSLEACKAQLEGVPGGQ